MVRSLPKNFEEKDLHLFANDLVMVILVPQLNHLSNLIIDYNGNCFNLFSSVACNKLSISKEAKTRSALCILKDFCKVCFRRKTIYVNNAGWVCDLWSQNYFHWFFDTLPKLIIMEMSFPNYSILIPENLYENEFIQQSILHFKLKFVILPSFNLVKAKHYIGVPNLSPSGNYIPMVISLLREKFSISCEKPFRKIFVIREPHLKREIVNINEVNSILKKYSFEILSLNKIKLQEQIKIFSETSLFIAVHGAALTNMLFMPKKSSVMELRRKDDASNNCYFSLASALEIPYYYQLCEVDNYTKPTQENNFKVCPIQLEKNIEQMLGLK